MSRHESTSRSTWPASSAESCSGMGPGRPAAANHHPSHPHATDGLCLTTTTTTTTTCRSRIYSSRHREHRERDTESETRAVVSSASSELASCSSSPSSSSRSSCSSQPTSSPASSSKSVSSSLSKLVSPLLGALLITSALLRIAEACSSRSTPKPRPPSPTTRPNITFQTYACPEAYAKWYCLNGATCFSVRIGESILYNCECADGYMGQRCEFKDLDGSYLPSRERVLIEKASVAGGVTVAILLMVVISILCFSHARRKRKEKLLFLDSGGGSPRIAAGPASQQHRQLRPFCLALAQPTSPARLVHHHHHEAMPPRPETAVPRRQGEDEGLTSSIGSNWRQGPFSELPPPSGLNHLGLWSNSMGSIATTLQHHLQDRQLRHGNRSHSPSATAKQAPPQKAKKPVDPEAGPTLLAGSSPSPSSSSSTSSSSSSSPASRAGARSELREPGKAKSHHYHHIYGNSHHDISINNNYGNNGSPDKRGLRAREEEGTGPP